MNLQTIGDKAKELDSITKKRYWPHSVTTENPCQLLATKNQNKTTAAAWTFLPTKHHKAYYTIKALEQNTTRPTLPYLVKALEQTLPYPVKALELNTNSDDKNLNYD
jgi:hypothetical protein